MTRNKECEDYFICSLYNLVLTIRKYAFSINKTKAEVMKLKLSHYNVRDNSHTDVKLKRKSK